MLDSLDIQRFFPMRRPFVRFRYPLGEGLSSRPWCVNFQSPLFNQPLTQPHAAFLSYLSLMPFSASLSRSQPDSAFLGISLIQPDSVYSPSSYSASPWSVTGDGRSFYKQHASFFFYRSWRYLILFRLIQCASLFQPFLVLAYWFCLFSFSQPFSALLN